jgi:hypothetical protein
MGCVAADIGTGEQQYTSLSEVLKQTVRRLCRLMWCATLVNEDYENGGSGEGEGVATVVDSSGDGAVFLVSV